MLAWLMNMGFAAAEAVVTTLARTSKDDIFFASESRDIVYTNQNREIFYNSEDRQIDL